MHDNITLREIRALEYMLFGGVPAHPEPMYSAGEYRYHGDIMHTRNVGEQALSRHSRQGRVIGVLRYNLTTREMVMSDPDDIEE
jgi:hypothetical protein